MIEGRWARLKMSMVNCCSKMELGGRVYKFRKVTQTPQFLRRFLVALPMCT